MTQKRYDVIAIGNAIMDVLAKVDEDFVTRHGIRKGTMMLMDEEAAKGMQSEMQDTVTCSGGSAANTLAGLADLGASTAFVGKVRDDNTGAAFRKGMQDLGIAFDTPAATDGPSTGRCLVSVTPDGERTMGTYLGVCDRVLKEDIDPVMIEAAKLLYIEGYLWDQPHAKEAILTAMDYASNDNLKMALTLSDVFCVERHREEFLDLILNKIDILFANEAELKSLFETDDFDAAAKKLQGMLSIAVITRSEHGAVLISEDGMQTIPTSPVVEVVDATGAGDMFAAGFLYGYGRDWPIEQCAQLGHKMAGSIIQQMGARSAHSLRDLLDSKAA